MLPHEGWAGYDSGPAPLDLLGAPNGLRDAVVRAVGETWTYRPAL